MDGHLTAFRVNRFLAWLYGLGLVALFAYDYLRPNALPARYLLLAYSTLPGLVVLHGVLAFGCRLRKTWARFGSMLVGIPLLFGFPVGTIAGGLLIWASAHPWPDARAHAGAARGGWHGDGRRR